MVPLQHPWGRAPSLGPCLWQRSAAGCPKTPILGPTRPLSPKVSLKKRVFPGYPPTQQGTHMVPLQHPWGRAPSLGPCLWQRSAAGCPKTPILGHTRPLSPKVSLKNEFSLGTHQAGRVPTWSLYNTHGVAPLRLAPFLGYTGVIPMLIHSHNTPPPTLVPTVSLKNEFSQDTHLPSRVPTWSPLQHPWGRAPSLGPCLWQRSAAGCPKTPILGPTRPLSPKVSLKNEFSLGTHLPSRVPTWSLYNTHGVAPRRLAPVSGNEALPDAQKHLFWVPPGHFRPRSP